MFTRDECAGSLPIGVAAQILSFRRIRACAPDDLIDLQQCMPVPSITPGFRADSLEHLGLCRDLPDVPMEFAFHPPGWARRCL